MLRHLLPFAVIAFWMTVLPGSVLAGTGEVRVDFGPHSPLSIVVREFGWLDDAARNAGIRIQWVATPDLDAAAEALAGDRLDVAATTGAAAVSARAEGAPIKAVYVAWKTADSQFALLNVREDVIRNTPVLARQVLQSYERARRWVIAHPDRAAELVAQWGKTSIEGARGELQRVDFSASAPGPSQATALRGTARTDADRAAVEGLLDRGIARSVLATLPLKHTRCGTFCDQW